MSTEQSGPTCTISNAQIKWGPGPTIEINRYGLPPRLTKLRRIWHNTRCHWPPDEDEPFYPMQKGPRRTAVRNDLPERNHTITWHSTRHYYRQRDSVYIRIIEVHYRETWNWTKIMHGFLPTNGQTDRMNECDTRTVSTSQYQVSTRQLERAITIRRIRIQQWLSGDHQDHTLLRILRNQPRTSAYHAHYDLEDHSSKRH